MSAVETAERYFSALDQHDLETATRLWAAGGVDRIAGRDLVAPEGVRSYFEELLEAFPDFRIEPIGVVADTERVAVRWRAHGTFAGPGRFQGFAPNGARITIEGCDVLVVDHDRIRHNDAYLDSGELARQLGVLPATGSRAERGLTRLANVRTRAAALLQGTAPEPIADGVWVVRGGVPRTMNVYLLADGDGVTVFDAGVASMTPAVLSAGARLGGIRRVVLGHADADHRGVAPAVEAPILCHEREREAAGSASSFRPYWDMTKLAMPGPLVFPRLLPMWDGGGAKIADTVAEGDEIAGFRVVELPGHAPGLIGLFRESDRLALVSDCIYTIDPVLGRKGAARVPHPAFNVDTGLARQSIRTLAALSPTLVWSGHADPVRQDVVGELERAASAPAP